MQDDYEGVVSPPPLDGAFCARLAFVATGQSEFQEPLRSDEGYGENEDRSSAQHRKKTCSAEKPGPKAERTP